MSKENKMKKKFTPTDEELKEFITESNAIEREYSEEALDDSLRAWLVGVMYFREEFSIDLIAGIHSRIMNRLNHKIAGRIRKVPIYVGNSISFRECLKPELVRPMLEKLIKAWNDNKMELKDIYSEIEDSERRFTTIEETYPLSSPSLVNI